MSEVSSLDELLANQKREKKELNAKTQKMKHGVPKGDKKKKKEVTTEIAQLLADLDLKHENEIKEFERTSSEACTTAKKVVLEIVENGHPQDEVLSSENVITGDALGQNTITDKDGDECAKGPQRMSKAQKRRNKKAMLEKERNKAIAEQEVENLNSLRHLESEDIKKKLLDRHLAIHEIPSDGNCLYKAIEHQLSSLNLKQMTSQTLRELTSKYMLSHMEDYLPFLTCPETGNILTEEQYIKYCEDIANTSAWGGHIEIQALSHICERPVEVIQAKGPSVIAGNEDSNPKIILSYHRHVYGLGEHYNSVVPATDE